LKGGKTLRPMVKTPNLISKGGGKQREGRGFSIGELKEAGLSVAEAVKLGVYIDKRRRSTHEYNVKALKEYLARLNRTVKSLG